MEEFGRISFYILYIRQYHKYGEINGPMITDLDKSYGHIITVILETETSPL